MGVCVCVQVLVMAKHDRVFFPASRPEFSQKPGRGRGRATVANFIPDQTNFHISCSGRPLLGSSSHTLIHEYTHNWHGNGCNLLLQKKKNWKKKTLRGESLLQRVGGTDFLKAFGRYSNPPPHPSHSNFPFSGAKKKRKHFHQFILQQKKKKKYQAKKTWSEDEGSRKCLNELAITG